MNFQKNPDNFIIKMYLAINDHTSCFSTYKKFENLKSVKGSQQSKQRISTFIIYKVIGKYWLNILFI